MSIIHVSIEMERAGSYTDSLRSTVDHYFGLNESPGYTQSKSPPPYDEAAPERVGTAETGQQTPPESNEQRHDRTPLSVPSTPHSATRPPRLPPSAALAFLSSNVPLGLSSVAAPSNGRKVVIHDLDFTPARSSSSIAFSGQTAISPSTALVAGEVSRCAEHAARETQAERHESSSPGIPENTISPRRAPTMAAEPATGLTNAVSRAETRPLHILPSQLAGRKRGRSEIETDEQYNPEPASEEHKTLILFTDGSFKPDESGSGPSSIGVAYRDEGMWWGAAVALGTLRGILIAELGAIADALLYAQRAKGTVHKVRIYSDSTDALFRVEQARIGRGGQPELAHWIAEHIERMRHINGVEIMLKWVKGHKMCVGNLIADRLANAGAERSKVLREATETRSEILRIPVNEMINMACKANASVSQRKSGEVRAASVAEQRSESLDTPRGTVLGDDSMLHKLPPKKQQKRRSEPLDTSAEVEFGDGTVLSMQPPTKPPKRSRSQRRRQRHSEAFSSDIRSSIVLSLEHDTSDQEDTWSADANDGRPVKKKRCRGRGKKRKIQTPELSDEAPTGPDGNVQHEEMDTPGTVEQLDQIKGAVEN